LSRSILFLAPPTRNKQPLRPEFLKFFIFHKNKDQNIIFKMRKLFFDLILLFCATVLEWIKLKDDPSNFYLETDQSENVFCRLREIPEKIGFLMLTLGGVIFVVFFVKKYYKVNGHFFLEILHFFYGENLAKTKKMANG